MVTNNNVYVSREFGCSKPILFKWIVRPDLISKWFGPKHMVVKNAQSDLNINGTYSIELLRPDGISIFISGMYIEIEEPHKLKFSFRYSGQDNLPPESTVEISLEAIDPDTTKLSLVQKFETYPSDMEARTQAWKNMFKKLEDELNMTSNNT